MPALKSGSKSPSNGLTQLELVWSVMGVMAKLDTLIFSESPLLIMLCLCKIVSMIKNQMH